MFAAVWGVIDDAGTSKSAAIFQSRSSAGHAFRPIKRCRSASWVLRCTTSYCAVARQLHLADTMTMRSCSLARLCGRQRSGFTVTEESHWMCFAGAEKHEPCSGDVVSGVAAAGTVSWHTNANNASCTRHVPHALPAPRCHL